MKNNVIFILVLLISLVFLQCTDKNPVELTDVLNGTWVEVYDCVNAKCNNAFDSVLSAVLVINGGDFSSVLYKDGGQTIYDTSFSGKISITNDTLKFILGHFREVFLWKFLNGKLLLQAIYSIGPNGYTIIDFRSILWCCDIKKRGFFE